MKRPRYLIGLGVLVAALALTALACGDGDKKDTSPTDTPADQTPAATQPAAETPEATAETPQATTEGTPQATLATAGGVLTSADGMTLYTFDSDTAGTSACNAGCTTNWPPLTIAGGAPTADPSLTGTVGTITRDDGTTQVTYNGKPVYHYAGDTAAGDKNGDGIGGVWHVALP